MVLAFLIAEPYLIVIVVVDVHIEPTGQFNVFVFGIFFKEKFHELVEVLLP